MRHPVRHAMLFLSLAVATPVFAQSASANAPIDSSKAIPMSVATDTATQLQPALVTAGASTIGLRAGVHSRETTRPSSPTMAAQSQHMGQDKAMMVVGLAALVTGAIIGGTPGTIVMVGGAVVGLMGLYNYMQ